MIILYYLISGMLLLSPSEQTNKRNSSARYGLFLVSYQVHLISLDLLSQDVSRVQHIVHSIFVIRMVMNLRAAFSS